jgi:hypothetical protein
MPLPSFQIPSQRLFTSIFYRLLPIRDTNGRPHEAIGQARPFSFPVSRLKWERISNFPIGQNDGAKQNMQQSGGAKSRADAIGTQTRSREHGQKKRKEKRMAHFGLERNIVGGSFHCFPAKTLGLDLLFPPGFRIAFYPSRDSRTTFFLLAHCSLPPSNRIEGGKGSGQTSGLRWLMPMPTMFGREGNVGVGGNQQIEMCVGAKKKARANRTAKLPKNI